MLLKHLQVLQAPDLLKECCQILQPQQNTLIYNLTTKALPFLLIMNICFLVLL